MLYFWLQGWQDEARKRARQQTWGGSCLAGKGLRMLLCRQPLEGYDQISIADYSSSILKAINKLEVTEVGGRGLCQGEMMNVLLGQ